VRTGSRLLASGVSKEFWPLLPYEHLRNLENSP
jgi:hypothetical protein